MVSIPDWSKFSRTSDSCHKSDSTEQLSKYFKQQELVAIKQAEQTGYFLLPSSDYLLRYLGPFNGTKKHLSKIFLVRLISLHLRQLGDIPLCMNLQICILANNFLTKIDALSTCEQLVKLDLHGNQLASIPGPSFWTSFTKLRALYLHDNPLGNFETFKHLSSAPALTIVTLFDTPLYLKVNYRHHVVNSIWTLKALDYHVISDEEIIEDAFFGGHFSALSPSFRIDLCSKSPKEATFKQEMQLLHQIEAKVNKILSKHSPVIIVQRFVRGYLTRKRLGLVPCRIYRGRQKYPDVLLLPPVDRPSQLTLVGPEITPSPSSAGVSSIFRTGKSSSELGMQLKIYISVSKLHNETLQLLQTEADKLEPFHAWTVRGETKSKKYTKKQGKQEPCKNIKIKKQPFGPLVNSETDVDEDHMEDDELLSTCYRLRGSNTGMLLSNATSEMILSNVEAGKQVREAEDKRVQKLRTIVPPKIKPLKFCNKNQHLFTRVQGTMKLSCLLAVQKAYKDREKAEKALVKKEYIAALRKEKQQAKDRICRFQDEKRNQILVKKDQDRVRIMNQAEKNELLHLNYLDKRQDVKNRAYIDAMYLKADNTFMMEFVSHHTSVSNVVGRHDRLIQQEEILSSNKNKVDKLRIEEVEGLESAKKYMEHRQLLQQTESSMARAALDSRMLQETAERLMKARQKVAHVKAKEASAQLFCPLLPSTFSTAVVDAPAGMSHWNAGILPQHGRASKHTYVNA